MKSQHSKCSSPVLLSSLAVGVLVSTVALAQSPQAQPKSPQHQPPAKSSSTPRDDLRSGHMKTPAYAQALATSLNENTIEIFDPPHHLPEKFDNHKDSFITG